jgi:gliding motility-associated-like protein
MVNLTPSISMDGAFNINCAGASTGSIAASAVNNIGPVSYVWVDGAVGSDRTSLSAGSYKVIITDSNNCTAESALTLIDPDPIELSFDVVNTFCPDSKDGAVTVNATGGVNGYDYTYLWETNSSDKQITGVGPGRYNIIVTDLNLCSVKGSAGVRSLHELCLIIPDAFSPNDDLVNDTWVIGGIELYPNAIITIYNRWGQMLWQSAAGYPEAWDGRSEGINMPVDGYHYVIDLHNGYDPIIGDVTLVR